jgi:hypothetical protein
MSTNGWVRSRPTPDDRTEYWAFGRAAGQRYRFVAKRRGNGWTVRAYQCSATDPAGEWIAYADTKTFAAAKIAADTLLQEWS